MKQKLIVICGPTASGKTALAVSLAQRLGGEIVSADSMQVYRGMDIGTAKPAEQERGGIPHHLLDCADPGEEFGAAKFQHMARAAIAGIAGRGKLPILCGGTGLYISATVYPLTFDEAPPDEDMREELWRYAGQHGNEALYRRLMEADPKAAEAIHPNNLRRVIRALERAAGNPHVAQQNQLFGGDSLFDLGWVGLTMDRALLYHRIDERVDHMMAQGLLEEVERLRIGLAPGSTALQALGYKELVQAMDGQVTLSDAVERIKIGTRNYAKRQLTWFSRENSIRWFDPTAYDTKDQLTDDVYGYIQSTLHMSE